MSGRLRKNMVHLVRDGASHGAPENALTHWNVQRPQYRQQGPDDVGTVDAKIGKNVSAGNRRVRQSAGMDCPCRLIWKSLYGAVTDNGSHDCQLSFRL
jgi:hypothetical protein